ncbi:hypothetical protein P9847_20910, partial [Paenibacillus chibensis]|nr:hypothetical protein [Paenibacillus chibensis]
MSRIHNGKKQADPLEDLPLRIVFVLKGQVHRMQCIRHGAAEKRQALRDLAAENQAVRAKGGGIGAQHPPEPLAVGMP